MRLITSIACKDTCGTAHPADIVHLQIEARTSIAMSLCLSFFVKHPRRAERHPFVSLVLVVRQPSEKTLVICVNRLRGRKPKVGSILSAARLRTVYRLSQRSTWAV